MVLNLYDSELMCWILIARISISPASWDPESGTPGMLCVGRRERHQYIWVPNVCVWHSPINLTVKLIFVQLFHCVNVFM